MMSQKTFSLTAGVIFALIALGHILRVVFALEWTVQGQAIPMWASWLALLIAGYLAYEGLRLRSMGVDDESNQSLKFLKVGIREDRYKADFELLERYQRYSTELIRLSLLGIAGLAFFLGKVASNPNVADASKSGLAGLLIALAALLFLLATGCAVSHLYYSSDGMFYHLKALRLVEVDREEKAAALAKQRNRIYNKAGWWLSFAAAFFLAGGICFVCGFSMVLGHLFL